MQSACSLSPDKSAPALWELLLAMRRYPLWSQGERLHAHYSGQFHHWPFLHLPILGGMWFCTVLYCTVLYCYLPNLLQYRYEFSGHASGMVTMGVRLLMCMYAQSKIVMAFKYSCCILIMANMSFIGLINELNLVHT